MANCKFLLVKKCGSAASVLIPKPKGRNRNPPRITIDTQNGGKKSLTCPLHCCLKCRKFMMTHPGHISADDILGYVSVKTYNLYSNWFDLSCQFHHDGYVVLKCSGNLLSKTKVETGDTGEFFETIADKKLDWAKLFTIKTQEQKIPKKDARKRQW